MNIEFNYLYRDGANYKKHHAEIFSNAHGIALLEIEIAIKSALISGEWFYSGQWHLKDLHFEKWDNDIDHTWHEYNFIEETKDEPTVGDISDFIKLIQSASMI